MKEKEFNKESFYAEINGKTYALFCHTTSTRDGYCHTCWSPDLEGLTSKSATTKYSYCGRAWEGFQYETVLKKAIKKFPAALRAELTTQIVEKTAKEEQEKCDRELGRFMALHNGLTDKQKEVLEKAPLIETEEQAKSVMCVMGLMNVMNQMA